ncbi:MAG: carboxypeptidase-like regulatory domain-containing protein [Candidatus Sulfotelmatobacter sp.]
MDFRLKSGLIVTAFVALGWAALCPGQTPQPTAPPAAEPSGTDQKVSGSISGTVLDQSGAVVAGARVSLARPSENQAGTGRTDGDRPGEDRPSEDRPSEAQSSRQEVPSGDDGEFSFASVAPGPFQLTITAAGFTTQTFSGTLQAGQVYILQSIALAVAANVTNVEVNLTRVQVAQEQVKDEEKQRVFGIIPNFYVSYDPHPVPLNMKQKYNLAWKTTIDPFTFAMVGAIAGVQQADNAFSGYGQGAQGYGKRYGASFADLAVGTFLGSAILPAVLKQDPRYFYKGTGSTRSRLFYAIANAVICKGDNGRWQTNYSNILGSFAAGGISNLYYPAQNRNGAGLTMENGLIGIGSTAAANLFEEFFMKKLTSNVPGRNPTSH